MATKAVLIIGGSGFLGTQLALKLRDTHKVFATYFSEPVAIPGVTMLPFNLGNRSWAKRVVTATRPEVIIYVAGNNSSTWAERNLREAERAHAAGPATIAGVSDILQPRFIYVSNTTLFDGAKGNYHETDVVLPTTAMGKIKLGGENFIRGKSLNYCILRLSPVIGRGNGRKTTFFDQLRVKLSRGERLNLDHSELHSYVPVSAVTECISRLVDGGPKNKIMHFGGLTKVTAFQFGQAFAKRFGYDPSLILPSETAPRAHMAHRPGMKAMPGYTGPSYLDFSLNSTQAVQALKLEPLLLEQSLDLIEQELVARS